MSDFNIIFKFLCAFDPNINLHNLNYIKEIPNPFKCRIIQYLEINLEHLRIEICKMNN